MKAVEFKTAFNYPFNRPVGLLNILWIFLPIIGWFALMGYGITIIKHFIKGDFKELPSFEFGNDLNLGFFMFIKMIPLIAAIMTVNVILGLIPIIGILATLIINLFVVPMLTINFFKKETVESSFEIGITKYVIDDLEEYVIALLKTFALGIIFVIMFIVVVGIPAHSFTKNIFMADFYRRFVK